MGRPQGHYAKVKSVSQTKKYHMVSLTCGIETYIHIHIKTKLTDTENRLVVTRGRGWVVEERMNCSFSFKV